MLAFAGVATDKFGSTGDADGAVGATLAPAGADMFGTAGMPSADGDDTPTVGLGAVSACCPLLYAFEKKPPMAPNTFGTAGLDAGAVLAIGAVSDPYWRGDAPSFGMLDESPLNACESDGMEIMAVFIG